MPDQITPGPWHSYASAVVFPAIGDKEVICWSDADARAIAEVPTMIELLDALAQDVGECDTEDENPHREVWCIRHQAKRCTGGADAARAFAVLRRIRGEDE